MSDWDFETDLVETRKCMCCDKPFKLIGGRVYDEGDNLVADYVSNLADHGGQRRVPLCILLALEEGGDAVGPVKNGVTLRLWRRDGAVAMAVVTYLWIQLFYAALGKKGRAGFVMANSACDARQSEQEIRKKLLQAGAVDVMISIGPNFFYTVTLPCTLWFLDRGKAGTPREHTVLFLDARHTFRQVDRAHRKFSPRQIEFLANIVRL